MLKKYLGIVWMLLGPLTIFVLLWQAFTKVTEAYQKANALTIDAAKEAATNAATNTLLQWGIIIVIFLPIAFGMVIFGKYAWQNEYKHLPVSSKEL